MPTANCSWCDSEDQCVEYFMRSMRWKTTQTQSEQFHIDDIVRLLDYIDDLRSRLGIEDTDDSLYLGEEVPFLRKPLTD